MRLISHRGNIGCTETSNENTIQYINTAIAEGYDVEIDIRLVNGILFLGHDFPEYEVSLDWLVNRNDKLWVHTKNFEALNYLIDKDIRVFYHQKEDHTIINNCNLIWSHNLLEANEKSIIPLLGMEDINNFNIKKVFGICSDYISTIRDIINE